jgi:hypothetical protein
MPEQGMDFLCLQLALAADAINLVQDLQVTVGRGVTTCSRIYTLLNNITDNERKVIRPL